MSYPAWDYVNLDDIEEELLCNNICYLPLNDPVVHTSCQTSFCRSCIEQANWRCPTCITGTKTDFFDVNVRLVLNMLNRIRVKCKRCSLEMPRGDFSEHKMKCLCVRGCGMHLKHDQLTDHDSVCTRAEIACSAASLGCTAVVVRSEYDNHARDCRYEQMRQIIEPLQAKYNESQQTVEDLRKENRILAEMVSRAAESTNELHSETINRVNHLEKLLQHFDQNVTISNQVDGKYDYPFPVFKEFQFSTFAVATTTKLHYFHNGSLHFIACKFGKPLKSLTKFDDEQFALLFEDIMNIYISKPDSVRFIQCSGPTAPIETVAWIGEKMFFTGGQDGIHLWIQYNPQLLIQRPTNLLIRVEEKFIMSGNRDGSIHYHTPVPSEQIAWQSERQAPEKTAINCMVQLRDGNIAIGTDAKSIIVRNFQGKKLYVLNGHSDKVISITQTDEGHIVSGSTDGTVRVWSRGKCIQKIPAPGFVPSVLYKNGVLIFGSERKIKAWHLQSGKFVKEFELTEPILAVA